MKNIILGVILFFGVYQGWQKLNSSKEIEPIFSESYVAVYGRNSCGWTQQLIKNLKAANINYHYFVVDDNLHQRMKESGIPTRRYNLPVVDINGNMSIRPDFDDVSSRYFEAL